MKPLRYTADAAKDLRRHANMAARIRKALGDYAADPARHANNVRALKGSSAARLRVGDFRVIFEESDTEILVTKIGPRGDVHD